MPRATAASTEIDDIFASKSAAGLAVPTLSSKGKGKAKEDTGTGAVAKKKKNKKNKIAQEQASSHATDLVDNPLPVSNVKRKRPEPETVVDTSAALPTPAKRLKPTGKDALAGEGKTKKNKADEDKFRDSRGTGPRKKTEEGFSVYKEDELGIQDGGGDTPLCPFDCDCCF